MTGFGVQLSLEELLRVHRRLSARRGESNAVKDRGALEAALARARSAAYRTLSEQAAALLAGLAREEGFEAGNLSTAFAATAVFLELNGHRLSVSPATARHFLEEQVVARRAQVPHIAARIEQALSPI